MDRRRRVQVQAVVGTRPEIIKVAPVVQALRAQPSSIEVVLHHSGQHYSPELSQVFLDEFGLEPDEMVRPAGELKWHEQMSRLLINAYETIRAEYVLVQGDTNTALAYAMAARQLKKKVIHLEAGLRSDDDIVENRNRTLIADLANLHLTISETGRQNLLREGIASGSIRHVGSTAVDHALRVFEPVSMRLARTVLVTIHRPESSASHRLMEVWHGIRRANRKFLWNAHPRTWDTLNVLGIEFHKPVGYAEFLKMCAMADVVVSDSGGVAEEMTVFKRPVVQVRQSTERPEMLGHGMELAWTSEEIATAIANLAGTGVSRMPFGSGGAAGRAAEEIARFVGCEFVTTEQGSSDSLEESPQP